MEGIEQGIIREAVPELSRRTEGNHEISGDGMCLGLYLNVKIFGEFHLNLVLDGQVKRFLEGWG